MGWQLINARISRTGQDGGDEAVASEGYLRGTGHEDGFYCFKKGPWHPSMPYISQDYSPHLEIDGNDFYLQDFTFNEKKVFATKGDNPEYVFWSNLSGGWIYLIGGGIREPYYWTDIDEETVLGDAFYEGGQTLPQLNDGRAESWDLAGNNTTGHQATTEARLKHEYWEWVSNLSQHNNDNLCGKYQNPKTHSWKFVGTPSFKANNGTNRQAYYRNTYFTRSASKDANDRWTYEGEKGTISYNLAAAAWVIGDINSKWSEGDEPSLGGTTSTFKGYEIDQGTHQKVPDGKGDFSIALDHFDLGNEKHEVLMGEVSLWRKTMG